MDIKPQSAHRFVKGFSRPAGSPSAIWAIWLLAARPKTFPAAVAPVVVGTALAADRAGWALVPALLCLAFALLAQIAANYANDYFDYMKGADTPERRGPARAVAAGWVEPYRMWRALVVTLVLAFGVGLGLVPFGGWPLVVIGAAALVCAVAYTGGPYPLGYIGLGDLFVFLFFGLVAVGFTFYVQAGQFAAEAWIAGAAIGALTVNILVVNNCRDYSGDRRAGKKTLVARFGPDFGYRQYAAQLTAAFFALPVMAFLGFGWTILLPFALAGWAVGLCRRLAAAETGAAYNRLLAETGLFALAYAVLLSAGALL